MDIRYDVLHSPKPTHSRPCLMLGYIWLLKTWNVCGIKTKNRPSNAFLYLHFGLFIKHVSCLVLGWILAYLICSSEDLCFYFAVVVEAEVPAMASAPAPIPGYSSSSLENSSSPNVSAYCYYVLSMSQCLSVTMHKYVYLLSVGA